MLHTCLQDMYSVKLYEKCLYYTVLPGHKCLPVGRSYTASCSDAWCRQETSKCLQSARVDELIVSRRLIRPWHTPQCHQMAFSSSLNDTFYLHLNTHILPFSHWCNGWRLIPWTWVRLVFTVIWALRCPDGWVWNA